MGIGRYKNGKFDLILSLRHNADATRIQQWERSFRRASEILFDATDGQMQLGKIFVANNFQGNQEADAWLLDTAGTSSSPLGGIGTSSLHINLKSDEKNKPFIIIHEFGHYGLFLYDEYLGPTGSAECTDDPSSGACIMEFAWTEGDQIDDAGNLTEGDVNEFCTEENHDPDNDTNQESYNSEPCWETIQDNYPDVNIPEGLPDAPTPLGHEDVNWILLAEDPRFVLILDKSGSMSTHNAIAGVKYGADYWVRSISQYEESLSVITYNQAQDIILSLTTLTAGLDMTATLNSIESINPGGYTNIGGAMDEGINQILSPGNRAATQVMILFSDGLHNTGTPPEQILDKAIENGIRIYTIGFGSYADQVRLQEIAESTGGRFEQIDADPDTPDAELEIQNYLIEISGEVRNGSGIVTMSPGLLPEPTAFELEEVKKIMIRKYNVIEDLKFISKIPFAFRVSGALFDHKAYIESGSTRATFTVSYKEGAAINFFLIRPNGDAVNPTTDDDVIYVNPPNMPYKFYVIKNPQHGYWVMRVARGQETGEIPFKVFAFSENNDIAIGIKGIDSVYRINDKVKLIMQVYNKVPITDIQYPSLRIFPSNNIKTKSKLKSVRIEMKQRLMHYDLKGEKLEKPVSIKNGIYESENIFNKSGNYTVLLKIVNTGKAKQALSEAERPINEVEEIEYEDIPPFVRYKRFQLHIGPLYEGKDVETKKKITFTRLFFILFLSFGIIYLILSFIPDIPVFIVAPINIITLVFLFATIVGVSRVFQQNQ